MSTTAERREAAVNWYRNLGLTVFPYDKKGVPFREWPNPHLAATGERTALASQHWIPTFGVILNGRYVVIDIDHDRGGRLEDLEAVFGPLPPTATFSTPSSDRNVHLLFRVNGDPLRTSKMLAQKFPGIDFLALGSHVKGATSWRRLDRPEDTVYSSVSYNQLYPFLEPANLPADVEAAWRDTMVTDDQELRDIELAEAEGGLKPTKLTPRERRLVEAWIRESLKVISEATDGQRWTTLSRHMLAVYRNGVLLTGSTSAFDQRIVQAYRQSGGSDLKWLQSLMAPTKVFAAKHPKPKPAVSALQATASDVIGEWADAATAATGSRNKQTRKVIKAVAAEARTNLAMTTAAAVLAARYGLGHEDRVQAAIRQLAKDGWLLKTGEGYTVSLHKVNHYLLTRQR
jgi:hypothetical protein